jgi:EAL domain-containing protein (putative c-di-GMP-specific phosphodiesterase class I)/HAMP domain-containing protein
MLPPFSSLLRRRRGLATRAALFVAALISVTAALSAVILVAGASREGHRQQLAVTENMARQLAGRASDIMTNATPDILGMMVEGAVERGDVRGMVALHDQAGVIYRAGSGASMAALAARARASASLVVQRESDGGLVIAAPVLRDGAVIGAIACSWPPGQVAVDVLPQLTPFLLILAFIALCAIPLAAILVRRAIAPLEVLTAHAEKIARDEQPAPIDLKTGDEFETLADAFNRMTARLDASLRQIQEIAFVDPATRLPNQERFLRELDFRLLRSSEPVAVMIFSLQRLPTLTQTLDPHAARDLVRFVADRVSASTRTVDRLIRPGQGENAYAPFASRLGGSEFAVFAPGLSQASAARFAHQLSLALNQPFEWRGHKLSLGACGGWALAPRDGADADAALRHARLALGAAQTSPAGVKVYSQSLDREALARLTLEREMRDALERGEFRPYFQPKVNLLTGRVEACEALARWVRPDRTVVSPGRFIPVAEECGLIGPLSDSILREACWKAAAWARLGFETKVAVNVSALQFRSDHFAERVLRVIEHAGLAPSSLELEITESVVVESPERALKIVQPLRDAGVRFAIDDFGCGHSNLAALSRFPFDVIKIDQQFVRALERGDRQAEAIVDMVIALARTLGMEVVAEGVERPQDVGFMSERGCHWVQGFVYGAAVPAPEFAEMLRRQGGRARVIDAA